MISKEFLSLEVLFLVCSSSLICVAFTSYHNQTPKLAELKHKHFQNIGKKFIVVCYIEQGTKPFIFEWYKNGDVLTSNSHTRITENAITTDEDVSSLTIDQVKFSDSSNYSCKVTNKFGSDSQFTTLLVKGLRLFEICLYFEVFVMITIEVWRIWALWLWRL